MSVLEWIAGVAAIVSDLASGAISHDEAKVKLAEYAAIESAVDALERAKLGQG